MRYPHLVLAFSALALAACSNHGATSMLPNSPLTPQAVQPAVAEAGFATGVPEQPLGAVHFIVALPLRNSAELDRVLTAISDPESPQFRNFISSDAFLERYAPTPADLVAVARDMRSAGLKVSIMDQAVAVGGTQAQVERYFRTRFAPNAIGRLAPTSAMRIPNALAVRHATILGLSGKPLLTTFSHFIPAPASMRPDNYETPIGPYLPVDLKEAYNMPSFQEATGRGAKIGIVIDSPVESNDLNTFFKAFHSPIRPKVIIKKINGGGSFKLGGGEASLDVEQSGGIAPGAVITVYDIKGLDDADIYDGYQAAVKDGSSVVNSSFGGCELENSQSDLKMFDNLFEQGLSHGTTFVAASGDHGAYQCGFAGSPPQPTYDKIGVSWPADSIYVLAVGGTNLETTHVAQTNDSNYVRESANKDISPDDGGKYWGSGGGYSTLYNRPSWQNGFNSKSGRGVPDLALHMGGLGFSGSQCDAQKCATGDSSDFAQVGGKTTLEVGTSAASPDLVGLIALGVEIQGGPGGDLHKLFYLTEAKHPGYLRKGIKGNNGLPTTSGLWDPVLGLGTPISGSAMVGGKTVAGTPGSSSNP